MIAKEYIPIYVVLIVPPFIYIKDKYLYLNSKTNNALYCIFWV